MTSSTLVLSDITNTHQLGLVMYTDYIFVFSVSWNSTSLSYDWSNSFNI